MRYIIPLTLLTLLFGCKKDKIEGNVYNFDKVYGTYGGTMARSGYNTVKDSTTKYDTTFNTSISVSALTEDSIAVYITPYNTTFRIKYQGHNITSGWSFLSHPGGITYNIRYNPENDSVVFYYNTYSTNYVTPLYASGTTYTFRGKKQ